MVNDEYLLYNNYLYIDRTNIRCGLEFYNQIVLYDIYGKTNKFQDK